MDTIENANQARRAVQERVNFPPELAFAQGESQKSRQQREAGTQNNGITYSTSYLPKALPENIKLQTLTSNYADFNDGAVLVRFTHLFSGTFIRARKRANGDV